MSCQAFSDREVYQKNDLGGGFKNFLFSSLPGEIIQFDEHIFQMGWFNHQPEKNDRKQDVSLAKTLQDVANPYIHHSSCRWLQVLRGLHPTSTVAVGPSTLPMPGHDILHNERDTVQQE